MKRKVVLGAMVAFVIAVLAVVDDAVKADNPDRREKAAKKAEQKSLRRQRRVQNNDWRRSAIDRSAIYGNVYADGHRPTTNRGQIIGPLGPH